MAFNNSIVRILHPLCAFCLCTLFGNEFLISLLQFYLSSTFIIFVVGNFHSKLNYMLEELQYFYANLATIILSLNLISFIIHLFLVICKSMTNMGQIIYITIIKNIETSCNYTNPVISYAMC